MALGQTVTGIVFDPSVPTANQNITAKITMDDLENTSAIYSWFRNGTLNKTTGTVNNGSLVSYYPLDNDVSDYKGSSDLTASNAVQNRSDSAVGSGSYYFDGAGDSLDINSQLVSAYPFTMTAWFRKTVGTTSQAIVSLTDKDAGTVMYSIEVKNDDTLQLRSRPSASTFAAGSTSILNNTWYFAVAVFQSNTNKTLYLNGITEATATASSVYSAAVDRYSIGRLGDSSPTQYFNGNIDEARIYNVALTPEEVFQLYEAGKMQYQNSSTTVEEVIFNSTDTVKGDNWTLEVIPIHSDSIGTAFNASVLIEPVPEVSQIVGDPSEPEATDNVTFNITTNDLTVNSLTYSWFKDGTLNKSTGTVNNANLISYYPLDNDILDYKGTSDASVGGDAEQNRSDSKIGPGSYAFDGNDWLDAPTSVTSYPFTVMGWFYALDTSSTHTVVGLADDAVTSGRWTVEVLTGNASLKAEGSYVEGSAVSTGQWYHIAGVFVSDTNKTLYFNGARDGFVSASEPVANVDNFVIGRRGDSSPDGYFNGNIDEARLYDTDLTRDQIYEIYQAGNMVYSNSSTTVQQVTLNSSDIANGENWTLEVIPVSSSSIGTAVNGSVLIADGGTALPQITNITPANNTASNSNLTISFVPISATGQTNVTLYVNNTVNQTRKNLTNNTAYTFTVNFTVSQQINWLLNISEGGGTTTNHTGNFSWKYDIVNPSCSPFVNPLLDNSTVLNITNKTMLINFTCADANLDRIFWFVLNETGSVQAEASHFGINASSISVQDLLNLSNQSDQTFTLWVNASDDHTAKNIPNYSVIADNVKKKITFVTEHNNQIDLQIKTMQETGSIAAKGGTDKLGDFKSFTSDKKVDRYRFILASNTIKKASKFYYYQFDLVSASGLIPLNTSYNAHFLTGDRKNWIDFESPTIVKTETVRNDDTNYTITIVSTDPSLTFESIGGVNEAEYSMTFLMDTTASNPSILYPDNLTYTAFNTSLEVTADDTVSTWTYELNGASNVSFEPNTTFTATEGSSRLKVFTDDGNDNIGFAEVNFTVSIAPTLVVDQPQNTTYASTNITIAVNYTEHNPDKFWYVNNSGAQIFFTGNITALFNDGFHNLTVYLNDSTGNETSDSVNFTVDATAPTIAIDAPLNKTYSSLNTTLNINYTEVNLDTVYYIINGEAAVTFLPNTTFTAAEGFNNLTVWINDSAGNSASDSVNFTADSTTPVIAVDQPQNKTYTSTNVSITINYTELRQDKFWYSNDTGTDIFFSPNITVLANEGFHNFTIFMNDTAGNEVSSSVNFTVDTTPIAITIESPTPGNNSIVNTSVIEFNATTSETATSAVVEVNSTNYSLTVDGTNIFRNQTLTRGHYKYKFIVEDPHGNRNESELRLVQINTTVTLTISIDTPANTTLNATPSLNISIVNSTELDQCWYRLNSGANTSLADCANLSSIGIEGFNNLTVYVNESTESQSAVDSVNFTIDTTYPQPSIDTPTNRTYSINESIDFNWSVIEARRDTVFYNIDNGDNATIAANSTLNVSEGSHTVTLYANDSAGNLNSTTIGFTADFTIPEIHNISAAPGSTTATVTWDTEQPANSTVIYGTDTDTTSVEVSTTNSTSHSVALSSLSASTLYYYNVSSCDAGGNCNMSEQANFTTSADSGSSSSSGGGGSSSGTTTTNQTNQTNITEAVCGNDICEFGETFNTCRQDCSLSFKVTPPSLTVKGLAGATKENQFYIDNLVSDIIEINISLESDDESDTWHIPSEYMIPIKGSGRRTLELTTVIPEGDANATYQSTLFFDRAQNETLAVPVTVMVGVEETAEDLITGFAVKGSAELERTVNLFGIEVPVWVLMITIGPLIAGIATWMITEPKKKNMHKIGIGVGITAMIDLVMFLLVIFV